MPTLKHSVCIHTWIIERKKAVSISYSFCNYLVFSKNAETSLRGGDSPWPTKMIENALFQFSVPLSGSLRYTATSSKTFFLSFFWGRVPFSLQLFTYLLIKSYCIQGLWKKPAYRCTWVQMGAYISRVPLERRNVADVEEARCSHITVQYCRINPFSFPFRSGTHPITFIILFKLGVHSPLIVNRKS